MPKVRCSKLDASSRNCIYFTKNKHGETIVSTMCELIAYSSGSAKFYEFGMVSNTSVKEERRVYSTKYCMTLLSTSTLLILAMTLKTELQKKKITDKPHLIRSRSGGGRVKFYRRRQG